MGRPGGRGPLTLIPMFPFQSQTCHMPGQHPPSFQVHLFLVQPPEPPHQSHTANGAPTLSWALPTVPDRAVPPCGLSSLPGDSVQTPQAGTQGPPLTGTSHLSGQNSTTPPRSNRSCCSGHTFRPLLKLHLPSENQPILPSMSHVPLSPGSLP